MSDIDPIFAAVSASGSPFEIGERDGLRQFVNAPPDLNMLIEAARDHGDKTFIVEGDRRLSFEDVFLLRDALVPELQIKRGEHVAICMRNRAEWMVAFLAVQRTGGVAALVNSRGSPEELAASVNGVSAKLVLADAERAALLRDGGYVGRIIEADGFPTEGAALSEQPIASPEDPCAILFTSGTTGRVKGAVLSHKNLITGILSMQMSGLMVLHNMANQMGIPVENILANMPQQAVLQVYPLFHISGLGAAFLSPLFAGTKVVILRRWDAADAMKVIQEEDITQFTAVPTMLWDMVSAARDEGADLSSLRNIGTGGQALPVNLLDAVREICPQAVMGTGYGMTECSGSVAMAVGEDFVRNRSSAGRVLNLVDMKIVGPDGEELPQGEAGEIVVRGAMVMKGYWNNSAATSEVLSEDGWLNTGDVGYVDDEGYVFIVDRKKDMVISGGENIYCAEVERVMNEIPEVTECAAFGIADERLGELLVSVAVANEVSEQKIIDIVGEKLAKYKAPGRVLFLNEPLPRNVVGKVDKVKLRAMWPEMAGEKA
ncbi:class I adenylate-forming enzyme family protein [Parasphingorhabdus halotolerans]|uniref:Acyl--CoA ligase n=1 Tax=Parasphingorhabdus halotolerans TaxID=2725558 RepID=A0A6H2DK64_9SPHN|nr:class I adenylate-forming enzyme family protein [Parasphingorhabdus halotolerans]QJB68780.1 acyl--CoA ligase [Parasphingorhabdus halotolerans]